MTAPLLAIESFSVTYPAQEQRAVEIGVPGPIAGGKS